MRPILDAVLGKNTRMKIIILGMLLVTLFAWRAGWKVELFTTFCTAITALAAGFVGPHVWESVKNGTKPSEPPSP